MNINTLPDLCLRRIFYWLPLLDQITLNKVCPRWEALQSSVTCSRKAVTLIVSRITPDPQTEPSKYLHDYHRPFLDQFEQNLKPYSEKLYYSDLNQNLIDNLIKNLPNITSLTIRIKLTGSDEMNLIVQLLEHWKTLLTVLEFDCRFEIIRDVPGILYLKQWGRCVNQILLLFDFINRELLILECLNFHVSEDLYALWRILGINNTKPYQLDLPCLGRLKEFTFGSHDDVRILFDSLKSYAAKNERLESIYLGNECHHDEFLTIFRHLPALVQKFKSLPSIIRTYTPEFSRFLETFTLLETFAMKFGDDLQKFTTLLLPLKNLIHFQPLIWDDKLKQFDSIPSYKLHQLPSVKILTMALYSPKTFTELQSKHWGWIFPSVQLVHVEINGLKKPENELNLEIRRICFKKLLKSFKQLPEIKRLISVDIYQRKLIGDESAREWKKEWKIEELSEKILSLNLE